MNSLLTQTYPNIELILVDDGSTDNSPAMCDDFARKDSRVKVIHQTNKGTGAARNTGIDAARGELIGFADSDDFASPEMYAKLYALMLKGGVMTKIQALEYAILPIKGWSWHSVVPWNKLYREEFFGLMRDTMKKLILSGRIGFELRALKLIFVWLRSLLRPFVKP